MNTADFRGPKTDFSFAQASPMAHPVGSQSMARPLSLIGTMAIVFWTSVWTVTAVAEETAKKAPADRIADSAIAEIDSDSATELPIGELSVPPLDLIEYPDARPDWVSGGDSEHRFVITSGICDDAESAIAKRDLIIAATVRSYARGVVDVLPPQFDPLEVDGDGHPQLSAFIRRQYNGTLQQGDATMHESVAEISFDDSDRQKFQSAAERFEIGHRLAALGVCLVGGFGLLVTTSGVLNLASRRKRMWR